MRKLRNKSGSWLSVYIGAHIPMMLLGIHFNVTLLIPFYIIIGALLFGSIFFFLKVRIKMGVPKKERIIEGVSIIIYTILTVLIAYFFTSVTYDNGNISQIRGANLLWYIPLVLILLMIRVNSIARIKNIS